MKTAEKWLTVANLATLVAIFGLCLAGQFGFEYWWPAIWIVGPVGIGSSLWLAHKYKL
jgi:hypothetical protein